MKTIGRQDQITNIVERDPVATANLRALRRNQGLRVATPNGERILDPVIYANVHDTIIRLALRRYYKPGSKA